MPDRYTYPDSECLRNLLDIEDGDELVRVEARIVSARDFEALRDPVPGYFNLDHLQRVHRHLFKDVYEWAGETRQVNIHKPGSTFANWRVVDEQASRTLSQLDSEKYLHGRSRVSFVERLAHYYGELNVLHPFREGNGRAQRVFLRQLAVNAGWSVDWSELSKERNIEASRANLNTADPQVLVDLLSPLVTKL